MPNRSYTGQCHCGAVRFEAEADLDTGTFRCNCSICAKTRIWLAFIPRDQFRLVAGETQLTEYRFGAGRVRHLFCAICGVKPFGLVTDGSGAALNIACLDGLSPEARAALPVIYLDGAQDHFDTPPAITAHL